MSKLSPGTIQFSSYCSPPLDPGNFKLEVRQTVKELKEDPDPAPALSPFTFDFVVGGPRFALNPADIYSVYPPEGSTGDFAHTLPHVLFTRPTIPWERSLTAAPPGRPWMALLLLSAEDGGKEAGIPKIEPRRVRDLFEQLPPGVAGPRNLICEKYELDDPCNTIDIDAALFCKIAPTAEDLDFLAHVREVNTDHKETASFLTDGNFSVVIGNRFPSESQNQNPVENKAVLVSLEGMQDFLGKQPETSVKTIRLAVLASWAFQCEKARDFQKSMRDLGKTIFPLRLDLPSEYATDAEKYVRATFSRGYTALNHSTRLGEKTVSWYRGPLSPLKTDAAASYKFKPVPDALVRYDDIHGMMDLTYAGAAQLGRLLALQDRAFAQALCGWRTQVQKQLHARLEREELSSQLSPSAHESFRKSSETKFLESALKSALTAQQNAGTDPATDAGQQSSTGSLNDLPETVREWLARRVLLYGVPFLYLVPDERMLPMPSLRFFRIDPLWIKRLIEGACSVGRNNNRSELADSLLGDEFFHIAVTGSAQVRRRPDSEDKDKSEAADNPINPTFPLEGFLLRSPIVRGWQGLELEAKYWKEGEKDPVPAPPLRIDRLAPDTVLCIFPGPLESIEIRQPPEGMHFGASGFEKTFVRKVTAKESAQAKEPGERIELNEVDPSLPNVKVPFREGNGLQVVEVVKLAQRLHSALTKSGAMDASAPWTSFTSAVFGVQMTESPGRVTIEVSKRP